jgi:hypothetical protein
MRLIRRFAFISLICVIMWRPAGAQTGGPMSIAQLEDSLLTLADSMYSAFLPDTRVTYSERFARQLVQALKQPDSWRYRFDRLNTRINILYPEDTAFRVFNWEIAPAEETRRYYGAIQLPSSSLKLYGLVDYSQNFGKAEEDTVLSGGKWYGALYYKIHTETVEGQPIYILIGRNAAGRNSNKKLLEPLHFESAGPVFGAPVFNIRSQAHAAERVNRFIIEFKKDVQVGMNWDSSKRIIYFDNLVSQVNDPARKYTYVPSGQIDGFRFNGNSFDFVQDIVRMVPRKDGEAPIGESME